MSTKSSRSIQSMMGSEEQRERGKAKAKAHAIAHKDGGAALHALDPKTSLGGVLSAKNVQSILTAPAKPKLVPVQPAVIPAPPVTMKPPTTSSSKKKQSKHSVTLREEDVEFTEEFDAEHAAPMGPAKKKKNSPAAAPAPVSTSALAPAPTAEESTSTPMDVDTLPSSASLKKLKHRNFRAATTAAAATSTTGNVAQPADAFAPNGRTLSKAERKKLEKLAAAKAKKLARKEVLTMLHQSQMRPEQHKLLVSSTHIGQKTTLKQQLRRQFVEKKAGISHEDEDGEGDIIVPKGIVQLNKTKARPTMKESLDFFASTISPHIHPPKAKPVTAPSLLPAANTAFADDFGSFRSSALSKTKTTDDEDGDAGRGYIAGYIGYKGAKGAQQEEEDESDDDEAGEDDEEEEDEENGEDDDEDGENEDDENKANEDGEENDDESDSEPAVAAPAAPSNIYSVAFDVKPIRANKKKRKRVALVIPGQEQKDESEDEDAEEEEREQADEDADENMEDADQNGDGVKENSDDDEEAQVEEEDEDQPPAKKQKAAAPVALAANASKKRKGAPATEEDATFVADETAEPEEETKGPKLSRKAAKLANASVVLPKTFEAGKTFSKIKQDGPSSLYTSLLAARKEQGGTIQAYPGTETLLSMRVSNNDLFLGDREEGKKVDKNKKKSKESYEKAASKDTASTLAALPPEHRMPTLRTTPSGHIVVEVYRTEEIQAARMQLPLCSQEQEVMEAITENDILIISGETGSGKTTQVPQFLFEAGYGLLQANKPGLIGITEPRRVAAISTAKRVAQELNVWNPEESKRLRKKAQGEKEKRAVALKGEGSDETPSATTGEEEEIEDMTLVSYQIRYTRLSTPNTRIKFMTDGILLREIQSSFLLPGYSVIIVDEAHERGINTDILIGLLSKIVPLRNRMAAKFLTEKSRRENEMLEQGKKKEDVDLSDLTPIYPLKLIIMSATLRLNDFTQNATLFPKPPPVLSVSARQYPVTTHFHKFTPLKDYTTHALKMLLKMHSKLPRGTDNTGGILVFMTGKEEIDILVRQLRDLFDEKRRREDAKKIRLTEALEEMDEDGEEGDSTKRKKSKSKSSPSITSLSTSTPIQPSYDENDPNDPIFEIEISSEEEEEEDDDEEAKKDGSSDGSTKKKKKNTPLESSDRFASELGEGMEDDAADMADVGAGGGKATNIEGEKESKGSIDPAVLKQQLRELTDAATAPAYVLPLYSMLPTNEQMKVFQPPPSSQHRLIVISTNVAETSLTIPGIKYVLDLGREKTRVYDRITGTSQYTVQWISKASAAQRSGRSGRTGPGHAYRLYSSAVFDTQFEMFAPPEILRNPLEATILQMLSMSITDLLKFPFPTPPDLQALRLAFRSLELLGAVSSAGPAITSVVSEKKITDLGRILASFPVAPRFGKMLVLACNAGAKSASISSSSSSSSAPHSLLSYMIRVVATLSVEQLWLVPNFQKDEKEAGSDAEDEEDEKAADSKKMHKLDPAASLARQHARAALARKKEAKQRQQRLYNESLARWRHPSSDVLTMLRAMGGYEHVQSQANAQAQAKIKDPSSKKSSAAAAALKLASHRCQAFLQTNFLRVKAVEEIQALQKQLKKIATEMLEHNVQQVQSELNTGSKGELQSVQNDPSTSPEEQAEANSQSTVVPVANDKTPAAAKPYLQLLASIQNDSPLPPPSPGQETLLTQILCAGFIDHVARKMSSERKQALMESWKSKIKTDEEEEEGFILDGAYECLATNEPVFIHPSSLLFLPENQPDYLVYAELVKTRKLYMRGNTVLPHIGWLEKYGAHLVTYSAPIQSNPSPIYDAVADDVLAYRDVVFGPNRWELPRSTSSFPVGVDRTKHFLRLFLSGVVCTQLKTFLPYLLFKPHSLTNNDVVGAVNKSLTRLISVFVTERVDSRGKLEARWTKDPTFFLQEYLTWIQPSQHAAVKKIWPPRENSKSAVTSSKKK